jgi:putative tryptophan/tyrosine transport system substrate-binding protein
MSLRRRDFIAAFGGAAAWRLRAGAQQGDRMRRIGVLMPFDEIDPVMERRYSAFTKRLRTWVGPMAAMCGWTFGGTATTSVAYEELVGLQPDIIVTGSTPATVALQRVTQTIPIVFANVSDPVASGIVARLDRPGGNITGAVNLEASLGGKWLGLLSEIAPGLKRACSILTPPPIDFYALP